MVEAMALGCGSNRNRTSSLSGRLMTFAGQQPRLDDDDGAEVVQEPAWQPYGVRDCAVHAPAPVSTLARAANAGLDRTPFDVVFSIQTPNGVECAAGA
jgi:hypothetical protein